MPRFDLRQGERFTDKVLGCWIGKNCGGALDTSVEEAWGRPDPFDICGIRSCSREACPMTTWRCS
jgi:hypothetical protein